jgi:hypothetical protein
MLDQPIACDDPAPPRHAFVVETDLIKLGRIDALKPDSLSPDREGVAVDYSGGASQDLGLRVSDSLSCHCNDEESPQGGSLVAPVG